MRRLTPRNRFLLVKITATRLLKAISFTEPKDRLPCSQKPVTVPNLELKLIITLCILSNFVISCLSITENVNQGRNVAGDSNMLSLASDHVSLCITNFCTKFMADFTAAFIYSHSPFAISEYHLIASS
jgi:hypothetical protein